MNKKLIIFIILTVAISLVASYFIYQNQGIKIDPSRLGSETIGGQVHETTGSIPVEDTNSRDLLTQIVKLANLGNVAQPGFNISVDNNGKVNIALSSPYDVSKKAALNWLKNNGFTLITEANIIFTEMPSPTQ